MHFFQKQKYDAAGVLGVSLQKSIIFLMIVSSIGLFSSFGVLSTLFSMAILFTAFWGAYKRRPCLLSFYFWFNIVFGVLGFVVAICLVLFVFTTPMNNNVYANTSDDSSYASVASSSSSSSSNTVVHPIFHTATLRQFASKFVAVPATPSNSTSIYAASSSSSSFEYSSYSEEQESTLIGVMVAIIVLSVALSVLVTFFKIYSLILAFKMRKLLLTSCSASACHSRAESKLVANPTYPAYTSLNQDVVIPVHQTQTQGKVVEEASATAPAAPQQQPVMMYMPYPYYNQQANGAMPMPMAMNQYGQPVYYTYQPMAPFNQGNQL